MCKLFCENTRPYDRGMGKEYNCFIRISPHEYTERILDGHLYCNSLKFFKKSDNGGQNDMNEGTAYFYMSDELRTRIDITEPEKIHIFCMSWLSSSFSDNDKEKFNYPMPQAMYDKFQTFGNDKEDCSKKDIIYIQNSDSLIKKIYDACEKLGIRVCHSYVEYQDFTGNFIDNELSDVLKKDEFKAIFIKSDEYSWQQEYRFCFWGVPRDLINNNGAFTLDVGDIRGIATVKYACI